jgi:sugar lactone lactonase YvrE
MGPTGVAVDAAGNLYIADAVNQVVRQVTPDGLISTIVGIGLTNGYAGDGGPAVNALLRSPQAVAVDSAGNLYIADTGNQRVRKVTPDGTITTMAGGGSSFGLGFGDGGPATLAVLAWPAGLAVDSAGALYIADRDANNVRKVAPDGAISTVAGCFVCLTLGDGGPATNALLSMPYAVAVDNNGIVYIADTIHFRIRKVTTDGTITTLAGSGAGSYSGDGGPASSAGVYIPKGVAADAAGNVYIADSGDGRIRIVTPDGAINTIAGNGSQGSAGDGGPATDAALQLPGQIAVGSGGTLYFVDNQTVIRMLTPVSQ